MQPSPIPDRPSYACPRCASPVGRGRVAAWFLQTRWPCPGCGASLGFAFEARDRRGQAIWLAITGAVAFAAWRGWVQAAPWATALLLPVYLLAAILFLRVRTSERR